MQRSCTRSFGFGIFAFHEIILNFSCRHSPRVWLLNVVIACIVSFVSLSVVLLHKSHVYAFEIMIIIIVDYGFSVEEEER
mgnify:CR=1 FL=1